MKWYREWYYAEIKAVADNGEQLIEDVCELTFVSRISVSERCHDGLKAAVQCFRLRVKPDKGDIGPDEDGVGDAAAEILLSGGHVSAFFEYVHEVGVALVWSLQFEGIREYQLNLKVVRVPVIKLSEGSSPFPSISVLMTNEKTHRIFTNYSVYFTRQNGHRNYRLFRARCDFVWPKRMDVQIVMRQGSKVVW